MLKLISKFKEWRKRRYWAKRQLHYLTTMIQQDHRWLAEFPVADALTTRYLTMLGDDWYTRSHPGIEDYRESLRKLSPPQPETMPAVSFDTQPGRTVRLHGSQEDLKELHAFLIRIEKGLAFMEPEKERQRIQWAADFSMTKFKPKVEFPLPSTPHPLMGKSPR